jgi:hypothetical protein
MLNKCFDLTSTSGSAVQAASAGEEPVVVVDDDDADDEGGKGVWARSNWFSLLRTGTIGPNHLDVDDAAEDAKTAKQYRTYDASLCIVLLGSVGACP